MRFFKLTWCGWGIEETINNAVELKKLGVEFLDQP
jgi:hypothetical protein